MTLEEVADYLRVTRKTVYRMLEKRDIPSVRVGHQYRFDRTAIDDWLHHSSVGSVVNVLVVDDDEAVGDIFRENLELAGHQVTTATDSTKGLELAKNVDFDIVFLDLRMPVMDGVEFLRRIRAVKPDLPVTVITAYADSDQMRDAMAIGPFGVMKKPFRSADIMTAVRTYLRSSSDRPRDGA